jgi:ribosome modulation factor
MTPYEQGFAAGLENEPEVNNPFSVWDDAYNQWMQGWVEAQAYHAYN